MSSKNFTDRWFMDLCETNWGGEGLLDKCFNFRWRKLVVVEMLVSLSVKRKVYFNRFLKCGTHCWLWSGHHQTSLTCLSLTNSRQINTLGRRGNMGYLCWLGSLNWLPICDLRRSENLAVFCLTTNHSITPDSRAVCNSLLSYKPGLHSPKYLDLPSLECL